MKILINRTDAIGDTLLTLPLCEILKKEIPNCEIVYIASPRCREVMKLFGSQDDHWIDDSAPFSFSPGKFFASFKNFLSNLKRVRSFSPDVFIHGGGRQSWILLSFLAGVPARLGLKSKLLSFLFLNQGIRQKRSSELKHEVLWNFELIAPFLKKDPKEWISLDQEQLRPQIRSELFNGKNFEQLKNAHQSSKPKQYIMVHPGMTGHTLNLPMFLYVDLLLQLNEKFQNRFHFLVSYTPSDQSYIDEFKRTLELKTRSEDSANIHLSYLNGMEKGLIHYCDILRNCDLFIGPSTGTAHLASILNRPVLAFYSPIPAQHQKRWGPFFNRPQSLAVLEPLIQNYEGKDYLGETCLNECRERSMTVQLACDSIVQIMDL